MGDSENPYESPRAPGEAPREVPRQKVVRWKTLLQLALGVVVGVALAQAALRFMQWISP
jgi:hypothetical protein